MVLRQLQPTEKPLLQIGIARLEHTVLNIDLYHLELDQLVNEHVGLLVDFALDVLYPVCFEIRVSELVIRVDFGFFEILFVDHLIVDLNIGQLLLVLVLVFFRVAYHFVGDRVDLELELDALEIDHVAQIGEVLVVEELDLGHFALVLFEQIVELVGGFLELGFELFFLVGQVAPGLNDVAGELVLFEAFFGDFVKLLAVEADEAGL